MDLRPRVARRIIDRLQEFLYPMDDLDQARVEEVILDELSTKKSWITSRAGFVVSTEDQDCVQAFLDMYPDLRTYVDMSLLPKLREMFPKAPLRMTFWVDPEAGFSGLYENRSLTIGVLLPEDLTYKERSDLFDPFEEWEFESEVPSYLKSLVNVWAESEGNRFPTRIEAAFDWLNIKRWYLTGTVGLSEDLVERLYEDGEVTESEMKDLCERLGISYQWITDPAPPPASAYESWDEFRTRKGE